MATRLFKSIHRKGLILAILLFSCFSYSVWGAQDQESGKDKYDFTYTYTRTNSSSQEEESVYIYFYINDEATVTVIYGDTDPSDDKPTDNLYYEGDYNGVVVIPEKVTYIDPDTEEETEYTVTGIHEDAFKQCYNLTSVTIPSTVTSIGTKAFYHCTSLTEVKNFDSETSTVTSIGDQAFEGCTELITADVFSSNLTSIGWQAFYDCEALTIESLDLSTVTSIGRKAFYKCVGIGSFTLSTSLDKIEYQVFQGCNISSITIPESVTVIEHMAFQGSGLTNIEIPATVTVIEYQAFYQCRDLTEVTLNEGLETIGYSAFEYSGITSVTIPESVTTWEISTSADPNGSYAFANCTSLEKVTFQEGLTSIGSYAFEGCSNSNFTTITIPESMEEIGDGAFSGCSSLASLIYNAKACISFGENVFLNCGALTTLTIGTTVQVLPKAFDELTHLVTINYNPTYESVTIKDSDGTEVDLSTNQKSLFVNATGLTTVTIGEGVVNLPDYIFASCTVKEVTINSSNNVLSSIGDYVFYNCSSLQTVTKLQTSITTLGTHIFDGCTQLTAVEGFTDLEITEIPAYTFNNCQKLLLTSLPSTVQKIDDYAFYNCHKIGTSESDNDIEFVFKNNLNYIGEYAFYYCNGITSLKIEGNITHIGYEAFYYIPIQTLTIGENVRILSYGLHDEKAMSNVETFNYNAINAKVYTVNNYEVTDDEATSCMFNLNDLTTVNIGSSVESIPAYIFKGMRNITSDIDIPESLKSIGQSAFQDCEQIEHVNYLENSQLTKIENSTFASCYALEAISFPDKLETIDDAAFENCSSLTSIHIPGSVSNIGNSAFRYCSKLETVFEDRSLDDLEEKGAAITDGFAFNGVSENCFLVVPEDGARFYTSAGTYGATVPLKSNWYSISAGGEGAGIPFMREDKVTIDITTAEGYVTHYSPYSYTLPEGWICGVITGVTNKETGELDIDWEYAIDNVVPAGSSVLIKNVDGDNSYPCPTRNTRYADDDEAVSESGSIMLGTVDPTTTDYTYALDEDGDKTTDNYKFYKLSYIKNKDGVKELGFYWGAALGAPFPINPTNADGATYATGSKLAWMAVDTSSPINIKSFYPVNENATGIEEIEMSGSEGSQYGVDGSSKDVIYNLQGIRVNNMSKKGIYIINGKKVAIK